MTIQQRQMGGGLSPAIIECKFTQENFDGRTESFESAGEAIIKKRKEDQQREEGKQKL